YIEVAKFPGSGMREMDLYLLEDYQFEFKFERMGCLKNVRGAADFFLRDKKLSPRGQGVVSDKRFPWAVDYLKDSKETEMFGFNLSVSFEATLDETPPMLTTVVKGNFVDLLKYVYGISKALNCLKLTFGATLTLPGGQYCITVVRDMKTCTENGAVEFNLQAFWIKNLLKGFGNIAIPNPTSATMTVKLSAENKPISGQPTPVSSSGCLRLIVRETRSGKAKMNLSEEGLKAFLDFVYCFKLDFPKEHPRIAVELLEFAHEKQVSVSRKR
ncbi:hypothetical protein Ocin01_17201, partial [Orchesella cincta]